MRHSNTTHKPTPYIEIDAKRLDRNLRRMQAKATDAGIGLRPHAKTHKSIHIARRQLELGAVGLTVSKPSEAMVFLAAGFSDVLLAYPVIDSISIDDMLEAAANKDVAFIADSVKGVAALAVAAGRHGRQLPVYLKVDVGLGRVGVLPESEAAITVSRAIDEARDLRFAGLLSHAGHAYAAQSVETISDIAAKEMEDLEQLAMRLKSAGLAVPSISTGSTPTALGSSLSPRVSEVRPGNYALLDMTAVRLGIADVDDLALSVIARVVSVNDRYAILDAGSKTLSSDRGPHGTGDGSFGTAALLADDAVQMRIERLSEEHCFALHAGVRPDIGKLVRIRPQHSCAVMAMFNDYILRDDDGRTSVQLIEARGRVW